MMPSAPLRRIRRRRLPCNVILREVDTGVEVSAVDPVASMQAIDNAALKEVAGKVGDMLAKVVGEI